MKRWVGLILSVGALAGFCSSPALAVVLYSQYDNFGSDAIVSTNRLGNPSFTTRAADDFVVPAGQTWTITGVDFRGFVGFPCTGTFSVVFYANAGSLPGATVASRTNTATGTNPDLSVALSPAVVLAAGAYWVSVQCNTTGASWYWSIRSVQSGSPAAWQEAGGYGTGCTAPAWYVRMTCAGQTDPDQVFRLQGTTAVTAVSFMRLSGRRVVAGIVVSWSTASELDMLGFNVYREVNGKRVRANAKLVAGKGRGLYSFLDRKAPKGKAVRYWIQAVNLDGSRSWYGPARIART